MAWNAACNSSGEALPGLEPQAHQVLELRQIGAQGRDEQLNRNRGLAGRAAAADIDQSDNEAIGFRPHPARDFVALLRRRGGKQCGGRCDQPIGRARNLHRADDLRHAGIDQLEPIADLAKRVDAGCGGQHGEAADPEEGEQQPRAYSEIPALRVVTVRCFRF